MERVRGIYQGFFVLSLMFVLVASFICISLLGFCTEDWLPKNLVIGYAAELILFVWGIVFLRNGASEIWEKHHSIKLIKELYVRVSYLMCFGIAFALIILCFHVVPLEDGRCSNPILVYSLNIMVPAIFFLVWTLIVISRINKIMRY